MNKEGIKIYDNIIKNNLIYVDVPPEAMFSFADGARVDFMSKNPNFTCDVIMTEKNTGVVHYSVKLSPGTFAKSNRKEISPLLIKAIDNTGSILLDIDLEEWAKENL